MERFEAEEKAQEAYEARRAAREQADDDALICRELKLPRVGDDLQQRAQLRQLCARLLRLRADAGDEGRDVFERAPTRRLAERQEVARVLLCHQRQRCHRAMRACCLHLVDLMLDSVADGART